MDPTTPTRNSLLACHYWITTLRLLDSLYIFGVVEYQLSRTHSNVEPGPGGLLFSQLALWTVLIINDSFMLTVDFRRNGSYLGCIATQAVMSFISIVFTSTALGLYFGHFGWESIAYGGSPKHGKGPFTLGIPIAISAGSSLCLLVITILPILILRSRLSWEWLWKCNTKDVFTSTIAQLKHPRQLRMLGHPRDPSIPLFYVPNATGRSFLRLISPIFFRRISPVETKGYAFVRNLFAASAVGVIVFRTTTALLQAQNKVDTRMKTRDCSDTGYRSMPHNIQVLTEYDSEVANTAVFSEYILNGFLEPCKSVLPQIPGNTWIQQIFSCDIPASQVPVFRIEIRSPAGSALSEASMPRIWLSNKNEEDNSASFDQYNKRAVRAYSPVWRLRPGFHVEAEARLITRRFISSSVLRDIVLNSDSKYIQRSLYPIVETSRSPLLDSTGAINASQATSTIHATLGPGFENYYRSQQDFWNMQRGLNNFAQMCDYIEDYRSGSVLDVLGSVGGLFALLQTAHVLLFGRPLLWGLTGAKLITPFGILGEFSSADFKRRLQEHYHRRPTQDNPETFRMGAFLRDFVIDLGPAGVQESDSKSLASKDNRGDPIEAIPPAHTKPGSGLLLEAETDNGLDQLLSRVRNRTGRVE